MTPDQYQQAAIRTECDNERARERLYGVHGPETPVLPARLVHAVLGLQDEAGEIAKVLKSWLYYGKPLTAEHRANLAEEFGDALWFICLGLTALGVSLEAVMEANIRKLATRYPEKFTEHHAAEENRDRDAERMALGGEGNATHVYGTDMVCVYCDINKCHESVHGKVCYIRRDGGKPAAGPGGIRKDTHVFDSSMTCDYCGAVEERTKLGDICTVRVLTGNRRGP